MTTDQRDQAPAATAVDPLNANDPDFMAAFDAQYAHIWADGAVPAKYKELAGVLTSIIISCEPCLRHHVRMAVAAGATRAEFVEMVRLGIVGGGSRTTPIARTTYTTLDEMLPVE